MCLDLLMVSNKKASGLSTPTQQVVVNLLINRLFVCLYFAVETI